MTETDPSIAALLADLESAQGETKWLEGALKNRTRDLSERIKELECLYGLLRLGKFEAEKVLQLIRQGWQFPVLAAVRIHFDAQEFKTDNFARVKVQQTVPIVIQHKRRGEVEVGYTKDEEFLKEETQLLKAIAIWLATVLT